MTTYTGYLINGYRFHTKAREINKKIQNSGVVISAQAKSYSTAKDLTPMSENNRILWVDKKDDRVGLLWVHEICFI